jgi:hypothetical protein
VRLLTWVVVVLWPGAVGLAVTVFVLLFSESDATPESIATISGGTFIAIAIPATADSIGSNLLRHGKRR